MQVGGQITRAATIRTSFQDGFRLTYAEEMVMLHATTSAVKASVMRSK
jgi:hypothetical protein